MKETYITVDISLNDYFEYVFWLANFEKYFNFCKQLYDLNISQISLIPDSKSEIQSLLYRKENDFNFRNKFLIDDQFLEPIGLTIPSLVHIAKQKVQEQSVLEQFIESEINNYKSC